MILVAALGGGGVWGFQQQAEAAEARADDEKTLADEQKERADEAQAAREKIREALYGAQINAAGTAIGAGDLKHAERILQSVAPAGRRNSYR